MKLRIAFFSLLALAFIIHSCDKIESPYRIATSGNIIDTGYTVKKVILIEEFTGQRCPNCPEMAVAIKEISSSYPEQLVVVAIHAGFFAMPLGTTFSTDYRTPAGNELDQFFSISSAGYPKGLVNRSGFNSGTFRLESDELAGRVVEELDGDPVLDIKISNVYSTGSRTADIVVDVNVLAQMQRELMFSVFITEDSIVSPQQGTTEVFHDYVHRHVLRVAVNGTWGESLNEGSELSPGTTFSKSLQQTLGSNWNDEHCHIVAFVYDNETKEVLQAAEAKIR